MSELYYTNIEEVFQQCILIIGFDYKVNLTECGDSMLGEYISVLFLVGYKGWINRLLH